MIVMSVGLFETQYKIRKKFTDFDVQFLLSYLHNMMYKLIYILCNLGILIVYTMFINSNLPLNMI